MNGKIKVMLTTEGTYPFHQGGVSTWCDILVHKMSGVEYVIYSIIMNPYVTRKFNLPLDSTLIKVPLWGTEEPSEHLTTPFSQVYLAKRRTDENVVRSHFAPLFVSLIEEIISPQKDTKKFGFILSELHKYFQEYDYKMSFKSELIWNLYKKMMLAYTAGYDKKMEEPSIFGLIQSLGWIYRFFNIINTPVPRVNVTHSAAAAFCGLPCVLSKIQHRTPFLLTEHGVYLREQYLSLSKRGYPSFLNTFLVRLINSITQLNYAYADQVSPVCHFNTRWERTFGVKQETIKVIYNGVDSRVYSPAPTLRKNKYPTVVVAARVDPTKDLLTMIRAAGAVKKSIPDVRFIVYGSVTVPEYLDECLGLVNELDLSENFIFAGHTDDMPAAYRSGDVIALSSMSEAFPYSIVEAMMTGKAIVATDVGGIKEALGDAGMLVRPQNWEQLASSIIRLLENPQMRQTLGDEARQRALNYFTIERVLELYLNSYRQLARRPEEFRAVSSRVARQRLLAEKGYALLAFGHWSEAVAQFRLAVKEAPDTPAVPVILAEIAGAYNNMGEFDKAFHELEKAETLVKLAGGKRTA
ncbi:MAG: GT4 family glycosyltransferase PelF [Peptococcaceae bacterium]|jgi:glycosyltransferase involved in cell wall biosynthesis|nr:GT4 family glycosyltransferase PelF [Peptococcaceae bacterium]MDH7523985.1 GT4 family glycosyltransferase PelF [Peptococcaceae bacterium]